MKTPQSTTKPNNEFPVSFNRTPTAMSYLGLPASDFRVLSELFRFYPTPFQSRETLAEMTDLSVKTVERALSSLKERGILDWERGHTGKSNRYEIKMKAFERPPIGVVLEAVCDISDLQWKSWDIDYENWKLEIAANPTAGLEEAALSLAQKMIETEECRRIRKVEKEYEEKHGRLKLQIESPPAVDETKLTAFDRMEFRAIKPFGEKAYSVLTLELYSTLARAAVGPLAQAR